MKFHGMRVLEDRDYKAFLLRKYAIVFNNELNCYASDQNTFDNQEEALVWADQQERIAEKAAIRKKARIKEDRRNRYILIAVAVVVGFLIFRTAGQMITERQHQDEIDAHNLQVLQNKIDRYNYQKNLYP